VSLADTTPQPWRNGGGTTRELLAWPEAQDWRVRVSVARIARDGPFSAYPGVHRGFAVLQGAGVVLQWTDHRLALTADSEPHHFDGGQAPDCRLLDGPTEDLNLMLRGASGPGGLLRVRANVPWVCRGPWRGVFATSACQLHVGSPDAGHLHDVPAGTLAWADNADGEPWTLRTDRPLRAWWLCLAEGLPT
jgi:environmental stress-induced protein Ves